MKLFAVICVAVFFTGLEQAHAMAFLRTAKSGQLTHMRIYRAWKKDCSPTDGVVRVVTKPIHGRLKSSADVAFRAKFNRFLPNDPCIGKMMKGFQIEYTSVPGYRGMDSFVLEITFGRLPPVIDTFTITVE